MNDKISTIHHNLRVMWANRKDKYDPLVLMEGEQSLSFYQKSISSFIASTITNVAVTPLDVVKVRLQAQEKIFQNKNIINFNNNNNNLNNNNNNNNLNNNTHNINNNSIQNNSNIIHNKLKRHINTSNHNKLPGEIFLLNEQPKFTSTWNTFRTIIKTEGVPSLWAGIWPTLLISIPVTIFYFPLYDKVKYILGYDGSDSSTSYIPPLAGVLCRTTVVILFNPLELYRTKLQSTKLTLPQLLEASRLSYKHSGPRFLFHGTFAALLRDVPFSAIYWFLYEKIKSSRLRSKQTVQSQPVDTLIAGAVAGSVAAAVTVPFDVIKTHWQIELGSSHVTSSSVGHMIHKLGAEKGLRGLFAGFAPRLIKVAPSCALMITAYDWLKASFAKYNVVASGVE